MKKTIWLLKSKRLYEPCLVVHAVIQATPEAEAGESQVQGHPGQLSKTIPK
jgi:hypothetical protein